MQGAWAQAPAPVLKAGFAYRDITPDIGMEQPGNYFKIIHRAKHDPCKVRASVFDDGKAKVAVIGIDVLIIRRPTVEAARKAIHARTGIPAEAILIGASHTHSGGPTGMILPGEFDHASDLVKQLAYEKSSCADAKFLAKVEQAIIEAGIEAHDKRADVKVAAGFGSEDQVSFNRRFRMKNGITFTHPGNNNPEIVEPAGPIDPLVGVLGAWDKEGNLAGCIVNFACHCTTSPGGASADYVYYLEKAIQGLLGEQAVVVFVPGMAGDVTQVNNRAPHEVRQSGEQASRRVGGRVGAEAVKALLTLQPSASSEMPLAARTQALKINRRAPSKERLARCMEIVKSGEPKAGDKSEWIFAKEIVLLDAILQKASVADVEVQAIQVGPAAFLACPAEYFCQFGLNIRKGSRFPVTFPVSLANDCVGYVPTKEALSEGGGGYETRLTAYSNLEVAAGDKIAEALIALSQAMTPGAVPAPPAAKPFAGKPWSYGSVRPERE